MSGRRCFGPGFQIRRNSEKLSNSPYVPKKNMPIGIEDSGDNLLTREIGSMIKGLCTENASVDAHAYFMVGR
jgi:hypothetical protein